MNFRPIGLVLISLLTWASVFAQTPEVARPAFEVAAIRPSTTSTIQAMTNGSYGLQIKGDRVLVGGLGVNGLIQLAYKINGRQLDGPGWLTDAGQTLFDIDAKLPQGATADQVPLMLQTLLADRFKLATRRGSKLVDSFALVEGKGGQKLPAPQPDAGANGKNPRTMVIGRARVTPGADGAVHVETSTIAGLVDYLSVQLAPTPVADKTGLQGSFDIKLDLQPVDRNDLPTGETRLAELMDRTFQRWLVALDKVGLKLERQKISNDAIIVEHVEKAPTEN